MHKVNNPCNHSRFLHGGNNTSPSLMFLSLKLDIGGHEPTIMHNAPSWNYNLLLGQSNKEQQRTCMNTQELMIKGKTKYITHHNLSEPSLSYVLGSSLTLHHVKNFKMKLKWEKEP